MGQLIYPKAFRFAVVRAPAGTQRWIPASAGALALGFLIFLASAGPAAADFRLCNNTSSRVGIAVGYKDGQGWTTEGWWNLPARSCETVLKGNLVARYYYVYAIDYDRGGEWMGQAYMCTRDKEFTIRGIGDCLARGYDRTGFFEVDTGEQRAWTVQLTEFERAAGAKATCRERSPFARNHGRRIVKPGAGSHVCSGGAADSSGRHAIDAERK